MSQNLLIFGGNSTAEEIFQLVNRFYPERFSLVRKIYIKDGWQFESNILSDLAENDKSYNYIIGVTEKELRQKVLDVIASIAAFVPVSIFHPHSYICSSAMIGVGCYIAANVAVSSHAVIKNNVHINYNVSVGHHSIIEEGVVLLPGSRVSGNVHLEQNVLIGSNSVVFQGVTIGSDTAVDALVYIKRNIPKNMLCFGSKPIMIRRPKNLK
jgi:carbonic anhydrase/acetyltransferase-like protein (isoleucine patch superfamily)